MLYEIKDLVKTRQREQDYRLCIRNLSIPVGAKIALTGPSGCGKSTTLDLLGLSLAPDMAQTFIFQPENVPITPGVLWQQHKYDALAKLRLHYLGFVLQSGELLPFLTVGENICLTAALAGMQRTKASEIGKDLITRLKIGDLWDAMPNTLSVGERQRAAIARALAPGPAVIIADEPTAALDPASAEHVMEIFLDTISQFGSALILATHNASWASAGGLTEIKFTFELDDKGITTAVVDDRS